MFKKKKTFYLYDEEIMYGSDNSFKLYHVSELSFPKFDPETLTITFLTDYLSLDSETINIDHPKDAKYLNNLRINISQNKIFYFLNLRNFIILEYNNKIFIPTEIDTKINSYLGKEMFFKILEKINNENRISLLLEEVHSKICDFHDKINEVYRKKKYNQINIKGDFIQNIYSVYKETTSSPVDYGLRNSVINRKEFDINLFGKYFFNSLKLLNKIKTSYISLKELKDKKTINSWKNYPTAYFRSYAKTKMDNYQELLEKLSKDFVELNQKKISLYKENLNLKAKLSEFVEENEIPIYYCFQCGNILFLNESVKSPECNFSLSCTKKSQFYCKKCSINFCTYCVPFFKDSKCYNNHLLFKVRGEFLRTCVICMNNLKGEGYACTICKYPICLDCYKERVICKSKICEECSEEFVWKRGFIDICSGCKVLTECFWYCKKCQSTLCIKCKPPNKGHCGFNHVLEETFLSELCQDGDSADLKISYSNVKLVNISCSQCRELYSTRIKFCRRCSYSVCHLCEDQ